MKSAIITFVKVCLQLTVDVVLWKTRCSYVLHYALNNDSAPTFSGTEMFSFSPIINTHTLTLTRSHAHTLTHSHTHTHTHIHIHTGKINKKREIKLVNLKP